MDTDPASNDISTKIKKEINPINATRKLRKRKIKMENNFNDNPNNIPTTSAYDPTSAPFVNLPPVDNSQNYVPYFGFMTTDQYKSLIRLVHLFPQLHTATLKGALELCNYDTIQTIDSILYALQYRKYLEAKNQGFPLDYNVRGPRVLLLPSFFGNRSTNSNVYEQLFQDNAHFNASNVGDVNGVLYSNCYASHLGATNPKVVPPMYHFPPGTFSQVGNENNDRNSIKISPPTNPHTSMSMKETVGVAMDLPPSSSIGNPVFQNASMEDKKVMKSPKIKRFLRPKNPVSRKNSNKPETISKAPAETSKIPIDKVVSPQLNATQSSELMNDCVIVENDCVIDPALSKQKSQCPLGDKDCNEIFQNKKVV